MGRHTPKELTLIHESDYFGDNEQASKISLYRINDIETYYELDDMSHDELCEYFNVFDDDGYFVMPGALYHTYHFQLLSYIAIAVIETAAYNV